MIYTSKITGQIWIVWLKSRGGLRSNNGHEAELDDEIRGGNVLRLRLAAFLAP
jgi:hypothetical protein